MDPAQPHFSNTDPLVRLDPTDATFVDVIHTDSIDQVTGGEVEVRRPAARCTRGHK